MWYLYIVCGFAFYLCSQLFFRCVCLCLSVVVTAVLDDDFVGSGRSKDAYLSVSSSLEHDVSGIVVAENVPSFGSAVTALSEFDVLGLV